MSQFRCSCNSLVCTHIHSYSQHATIIKISQLSDRLRAGNGSCKNSSRSFRASSAVHSKSSQRKGSSRSVPVRLPATTGPNSVPLFFARATLPCRCPIISRITQWNQCSFTAHHAPSIIRRTPFRFRLGHRHQPSATIATTADAHPLRVLHFTPDSSFTFYMRSHCTLAIPPVVLRRPVVARRFDKRC